MTETLTTAPRREFQSFHDSVIEIAKLALYVHGRREVTLDDVDAVMSDVSSLAVDQVVDAAFGGDRTRIDQGYRRLEGASGDRQRYHNLLAELELVLDQLRRRIGQTFTLDELAAAYAGADRWVQDALAEHALVPGWPARLTTVQDAAFHVYSRGAVDYRP